MTTPEYHPEPSFDALLLRGEKMENEEVVEVVEVVEVEKKNSKEGSVDGRNCQRER